MGRNQSFSQGKTFFAEVVKLNLFIFSSLVVVIAPWTLSLDAYWYISFFKILLSHQLQVIYVDYIRIMQTTQSVLFLTVWFRSVNDSKKDTHTKYLHPNSFSMPPRWSGTPKNYTDVLLYTLRTSVTIILTVWILWIIWLRFYGPFPGNSPQSVLAFPAVINSPNVLGWLFCFIGNDLQPPRVFCWDSISAQSCKITGSTNSCRTSRPLILLSNKVCLECGIILMKIEV